MSLFSELKRRNVFRVGIAYLVGAWLFTQVADVVLGVVSAPDAAMRAVVAILALGFIPTVIFAWVYEMTPEGVKKASEVEVDQSITHQTGRKLDIATMIMVVSAVAFVVVERYLPDSDDPADDGAPAVAEQVAIDQPPPDVVGDEPLATSIAVLPFANRSNAEDDLYFTDGIHDDLLTQLAKIHDLTVISRTSVMKYRDSDKDMRQIGSELQVGTILEGGVQKVGDRVRINAQLIEVATDRHLWAETFDRELTAENVFELQSEIARKIVQAISVQLTPEEERLLALVPTENLAAYESYLRAREVFYGANYSRSQEEAAEPLLERAIELDPNYGDAHVLLASIYGQKYWRGIDTSDEFLEEYRRTLEVASRLNPDSPGALRAQANYHYRVENDYARSLELLQKALAIAPGNVDIHGDMGLSLRRLGRWDESINSFKRALVLDPENSFYRSIMLETMMFSRKWQDILDHSVPLEDSPSNEIDIQVSRAVAIMNLTGALEPLVRVFERMELSGSTTYLVWGAYVHMMRRDPDKAIEVLNSSLWIDATREPEAKLGRLFQLANAWRLNGDEDKARKFDEQVLSEHEEMMRSQVRGGNSRGALVAVSMARLGREDEALALANRMVEENPYDKDAVEWGTYLQDRAMVRGLTGDASGAIADLRMLLDTPTGGPSAWNLHYDPSWDFMRDDERFVELATPENLIQ